jgi:hypothetical protein
MMSGEDSNVPIWSYRVNWISEVVAIIHYAGFGQP